MLLLKNGYILPMTKQGPFVGDILLENGKIRQMGRGLEAPEAQTLDLAGLFVMPGIVDAHCHIVMW